MSHTSRIRTALACAVFVSAAVHAAAVHAADPATPAVATAAPAAPESNAATTTLSPVAPASSGLRVYVDPVTGAISSTPTEEQRRALTAMDAGNPNLDGHARFTTERGPGGEVLLHTNGGNQSVLIARPGPDGQVQVECTDPLHAHASGALHAAPASPTARDER